MPAGVVKVAESGIHRAADVERLRAAGYQAFLVGEHLMKSGDPAQRAAGVVVMMVKICGITNREDALAAVEAGASAIGFNFYRDSPRYISPTGAAMIAEKIPASVWKVGVFVNAIAGEHCEDRHRGGAGRRATSRNLRGSRAFGSGAHALQWTQVALALLGDVEAC